MKASSQRIVVKIGTGVLTRPHNGALNHAMLGRLIQSLSDVVEAGHRVIVVSSGAVGAGMSALGIEKRPEKVGLLQACAAVGQARLMEAYDAGFRNFHLSVAQLLLTNEDFEQDKRRENVATTLNTLLEQPNVIPIINENDSVAVYELRFGDNDMLSARVSELIQADQLILLTSVPGLRKPEADEDDIITEVDDVKSVMQYVDNSVGAYSVGGMASKLKAVEIAVNAGISTIIAGGRNPEQLPDLVAGQGIGTRFRTPKK